MAAERRTRGGAEEDPDERSPFGAGSRGAEGPARRAPIEWMSTKDACERLGVTLRTLYRFIDEGQLQAFKMGRVIRLQGTDVDDFIERMRIKPGTLEHLYPEPKGHERPADDDRDAALPELREAELED